MARTMALITVNGQSWYGVIGRTACSKKGVQLLLGTAQGSALLTDGQCVSIRALSQHSPFTHLTFNFAKA